MEIKEEAQTEDMQHYDQAMRCVLPGQRLGILWGAGQSCFQQIDGLTRRTLMTISQVR